jgi:hypothetical protein
MFGPLAHMTATSVNLHPRRRLVASLPCTDRKGVTLLKVLLALGLLAVVVGLMLPAV